MAKFKCMKYLPLEVELNNAKCSQDWLQLLCKNGTCQNESSIDDDDVYRKKFQVAPATTTYEQQQLQSIQTCVQVLVVIVFRLLLAIGVLTLQNGYELTV